MPASVLLAKASILSVNILSSPSEMGPTLSPICFLKISIQECSSFCLPLSAAQFAFELMARTLLFANRSYRDFSL